VSRVWDVLGPVRVDEGEVYRKLIIGGCQGKCSTSLKFKGGGGGGGETLRFLGEPYLRTEKCRTTLAFIEAEGISGGDCYREKRLEGPIKRETEGTEGTKQGKSNARNKQASDEAFLPR